mgnify:CR=1 FL=1|tara:strand:- start:12307 stop:13404 length:1098 start_codon:yes stop_codon:yes gene_type:complete
MDKLLQEAIADAKAVRETALANAKIALEEAFTPHLKSMLSKKLHAEMEGDDEEQADESYHSEDEEEEVSEEMDSSEIGAADNKEPQAAASEADAQGPEEEGSPAEAGMEDENAEETDQPMGENQESGMEDENAEEAPEQPMGEQEEAGMEDEDDDDLAEVLRQLEQEMGMEDEDEEEMAAPAEQEEAGMEDEDEEMAAAPAEQEEPGMEDEDEIDLDEIIKALTEEDGEEGMEDEDEEAAPAEESVAAELEEYKQTVQYLRDKLSEVNLLNAKLLYTNKLFRSRNVSETQKMKVIEQFDRAANVREVKLVYTTFAESMKRKPVNESAKRVSQASKPVASTQPKKKPIIGEQVDFQTRMKKLANII